MMVWIDIRQYLLTLLTISLWRSQHVQANIPLYSTDVPEDKRGETIDLLERALLNQLGLKEKPKKPTKEIRIPQHMLDLYNQQISDPDYMTMYFNKETALHANTARSFKTIGTKTHRQDTNTVNLYFNASDIPKHEDIITAELQLFPNHSTNDTTTQRFRVEVYELLAKTHTVEGAITRLIDTQVLQARNSTQLTLDITPAALSWHSSNKKIHGIQIHVKQLNGQRTPHSHVRLRRDIAQTDIEWSDTKPVVIVYTHDKTLSRVKRGSRRRNKGSKRVRSECQRHPMKVDFKDVGWEDWILAPSDYEAYYCHGECPFPLSDHLNATNHAIIQTLVSEVEPEAVPPACCVPTDLSPISMLYLNGEEVVLKNYPDMVVEACGCR